MEETTVVGMSSLWSIITSFITGFLGAIVTVIEYVIADEWLALFLVAVPLGFVVFRWAKGLVKFKSR